MLRRDGEGGGGGRGSWVVARGLRERGGGVEGSRRGEEQGRKMGEGVGEKGWWGRGGCGEKVGQGGQVEDGLGKGCPVHFYPGQSRGTLLVLYNCLFVDTFN